MGRSSERSLQLSEKDALASLGSATTTGTSLHLASQLVPNLYKGQSPESQELNVRRMDKGVVTDFRPWEKVEGNRFKKDRDAGWRG